MKLEVNYPRHKWRGIRDIFFIKAFFLIPLKMKKLAKPYGTFSMKLSLNVDLKHIMVLDA